MLHVLDLFSGIGGFSLGLERTNGFKTVAFCECEPYATRVLRKHWPDVSIYPDVRTFGLANLTQDGIPVPDVVCGGFPCQDISLAGKGAGLDGERSGLWFEMLRIISETQPAWVIAENVSALRSRGLDTVLGGLASIGYDAEWHCIPAAAIGAPHRRDRVWIIAYPDCKPVRDQGYSATFGKAAGMPRAKQERQRVWSDTSTGCGAGDVADANGLPRNEGRQDHAAQEQGRRDTDRSGFSQDVRYTDCAGLAEREGERSDTRPKLTSVERTDWWSTEPDVGRVVTRISSRLDGYRLDADAPDGGTGEILRAMRRGVSAPHLQWPIRGYGGIQETEVLLAFLCEYEGKARPLGNVSLASKEASAPIVRGVWFDGQTACSSCRWAAREQRSTEHPDTMRLLSQLLACHCGSTWLDPTGTPSKTSRVDRLRCLGNAVVPQIPEMIGRAILQQGWL